MERAPVSFRLAKPVDPKTRHPFSGEPLPTSVQEQLDYAGIELQPTQVSYTPDPCKNHNEFEAVIRELKQRRAELDSAIELLERLSP